MCAAGFSACFVQEERARRERAEAEEKESLDRRDRDREAAQEVRGGFVHRVHNAVPPLNPHPPTHPHAHTHTRGRCLLFLPSRAVLVG